MDSDYKGEDLPSKLFQWQQSLKNLIDGPICDRIVWIWDHEGGQGISKFCKYMDYHHNTVTMFGYNFKDFTRIVYENAHKRCYLFDLTMSKPDFFSNSHLYDCVEDIKDGYMIKSPNKVTMNPPHVVIFSKYKPDIGSSSIDKYSIYLLKNGRPQLLSGRPT